MKEITSGIYYVGVNDRKKELFEGLWPLPSGMSYNSYLIVDEKICLVDTVEVDFFTEYLKNIKEVIGERPIDYIVVNHMEPDHSGSLPLIRQCYPDVKIIGNRKSFDLLHGFYGGEGCEYEVKNGQEVDLGEHKLKFVMTPMVHWPETMMTIDLTAKVLFSGDAFGSFGALNGGLLDSEINCDDFMHDMVRYYSNIVGKYGVPTQAALKKLVGVNFEYICSTHGPVWHEKIEEVLAIYDKMSKYETDEGIVIAYGTMYGNTEHMAEAIARGATKAGIKNIVIHNVSKTKHSYIIRDIFRYRGLIVGAPTYNLDLYQDLDGLLWELANRDIKNHYLGYFGSHGWASKAVAKIKEWNDTRLKFEVVGEPVDMKLALTEEVEKQCEALGAAMAERLKQDRR